MPSTIYRIAELNTFAASILAFPGAFFFLGLSSKVVSYMVYLGFAV
jgi:hypothetical protein